MYFIVGFPGGARGKEPACQCRRHKRRGFDPWVGKIRWRRECNPLQYSCLENSTDRGAWGLQPTGSQRVGHDCRDITLPTKVHLVKAMVVLVVMYGCESWTVKKAERRRIDAFELWSWRRLLRVPWTARRSDQSILREISQSWVFFGRTDTKAETPILWPPHVKN